VDARRDALVAVLTLIPEETTMRFLPVALLAVSVATLAASPAHAQAFAPAAESGSLQAQMATAASLRLLASPSAERAMVTPEAVALNRGRSGRGLGETLMIVGAAGIITGLLVNEDIVTIAGAGVGGYGLYLYLR
jgi:hypothetical protein